MLIVLTTTPNAEEAESLAKKIIGERLAACVQVLPPMKSFYFWENAVQTETEHLLLIKTFAEEYDALESFIQVNHSYDVPEIVAFRAENVAAKYLSWMKDYLS